MFAIAYKYFSICYDLLQSEWIDVDSNSPIKIGKLSA